MSWSSTDWLTDWLTGASFASTSEVWTFHLGTVATGLKCMASWSPFQWNVTLLLCFHKNLQIGSKVIRGGIETDGRTARQRMVISQTAPSFFKKSRLKDKILQKITDICSDCWASVPTLTPIFCTIAIFESLKNYDSYKTCMYSQDILLYPT
jgi:hypothetical protein